MKSKIGFILMAFFITFSINAYSEGNVKKSSKQTVLFSVPMHCKSCQNKIEKNIAFEKGVTDLKTDLSSNTVSVTFRSDKNTVEGLIAAFKKIGFEATVVPETGVNGTGN
jgi:Cu2+-exporting ATPase